MTHVHSWDEQTWIKIWIFLPPEMYILIITKSHMQKKPSYSSYVNTLSFFLHLLLYVFGLSPFSEITGEFRNTRSSISTLSTNPKSESVGTQTFEDCYNSKMENLQEAEKSKVYLIFLNNNIILIFYCNSRLMIF